MPELPEAEAVCRAIESAEGHRALNVTIDLGQPKLTAHPMTGVSWADLMCHVPIQRVCRRGKRVIFQMEGGQLIVSSLGMSGYWDFRDKPWTFDYVEAKREPHQKHLRLTITLDDGRELRYHDARKFGRIDVDPRWDIGPEPIRTPKMFYMAPVMKPLECYEILQKGSGSVKEALMDQGLVAGIGNIYASEICHEARISPLQAAKVTTAASSIDIWSAISVILSRNLGGISYDWLKVYRRATCGTCGSAIQKISLVGRSTFWCPACQS